MGTMKAAVGRVMNGISKRSSVDSMLDHVLLEVDVDTLGAPTLQVTATDGLVVVRSVINLLSYKQPGRAAVKGKMLFDFLSQDDPSTVIQADGLKAGAGLMITVGSRVNAVLKGQSALSFPQIPQLSPTVELILPRGALRGCLSRTRFAAPREDDAQQNLNSVFLSVSEGEITTVATDGRVFSCVRLPAEEVYPPTFSGSFILPLRAVDEVCRLLGGSARATSRKVREAQAAVDKGRVKLSLQPERMAVTLEDGSIVGSQLLIGAYPDVLALLQQQPQVTVELNKADLLSHLKRVTLFAGKSGDKTGSGAVHLTLSEGALSVATSSDGYGKYSGSMETAYEGPDINIAFNPGLLTDIVQNLQQETVWFGISRQGGSGVAIFREGSATFILGALWDSDPDPDDQ